MDERARELIWLRRTRDLSQMLGSEGDPTRLPPMILQAALELTDAERAFLVRVEGPDPGGDFRLEVLATCGFRGDALSGVEGAVSRSVVERTLSEGGRAVITTREADAELVRATSVVGRGVRSMVSVPLRLRGRVTGVLYLDHRGADDLFREGDLATLQTFATQAALCLELAREATAQAAPRSAGFVVGEGEVTQALREEIRRVSQVGDPVLICGEPGTEGVLVAREIHALGRGLERSFRRVDCSGDAGEVAGALLGKNGEPGLLARLDNGTLCLESVEVLDVALQRALARALQQREFVVPGSSQRAPVQARLVALTGVDLAAKVHEGAFEADLYYRLDVQRLVVPPLRQRSEDLGAICAALIARQGGGMAVSPEALERMAVYAWPGNLLELDAELRRLRSRGLPTARPEHLSDAVREGRGVKHARQAFSGRTLGELEEELVRTTMANCKGVKARAARQLGIPRSTLYHLLERYGLS